MAEQRRIALAFAGGGKASEENITHLLDDFIGITGVDADSVPILPDEEDLEVYYAVPVSKDHFTPTVRSVVDWLDNTEQAYEVISDGSAEGRDIRPVLKNAEEVIEDSNVNAGIINWLEKAREDGLEPTLILAWGIEGEEPDEASEILLDLATTSGIKVLDLTAGLDDLDYGEDEPPAEEPEPAPEPEEEKPKRRGRARASLETEEKPLEVTPEPEEPAKSTRSRRTAPKAAEEPPKPSVPAWEDEPETQQQVNAAVRAKVDEKSTDAEVAHADVHIKAISVLQEAKKRSYSPDLVSRFTVVSNPDLWPTHEAIRKAALEFAGVIDGLVPNGREKSLVLTNVEQAMFWANAGTARGEVSTPQDYPDSKEEPAEPSRSRGRPRADGTPAKPRTAADKAVTEWYDEEDAVWKRRGRGRIPKDAETRLVDPETGDVVEA